MVIPLTTPTQRRKQNRFIFPMSTFDNPFLASTADDPSTRTISSASTSSVSNKQTVLYYNPRKWKKQTKQVLRENLDMVFTNALPSEEVRDMPPRFKYGVGTVMLLGLVGIFASLFITSLTAQLQQTFLAPMTGTVASSNCESIEIQNTGQFLATRSGLWEGAPNFQYSKAAYAFTINNFGISPKSFQDLMTKLYYSLAELKTYMPQHDLADNLLCWTSLTRLPDMSNAAQRFTPMGNPVNIFSRQHITAKFSSKFGVCNSTSSASIDVANGVLKMQFPIVEFMNNDICRETLNPKWLGYLPGVNDQGLEVKVDVRSLVTAAAINLKLAEFNSLTEIEDFRSPFNFKGVVYNVSRYIDPKFPGMAPIACLVAEKQQLCTMLIGYVLAIPFFLHKGVNDTWPVKCNCSTLTAEELAHAHPCNLFQFLTGIMFWNSDYAIQAFELLEKYNYDGSIVNNAAFDAAFASSYWGEMSPNSTLKSASYINNAFSFCNVSYGGECSMLTFSAFDSTDSTTLDWTISDYYYQVQFGACIDSLTPTQSDW
jgi:hypothetical protein